MLADYSMNVSAVLSEFNGLELPSSAKKSGSNLRMDMWMVFACMCSPLCHNSPPAPAPVSMLPLLLSPLISTFNIVIILP